MKKARGILIAGLMIFGITVCGELTLKLTILLSNCFVTPSAPTWPKRQGCYLE